MKNYYNICWWNLENLFDTFDSTQRPEWLQSKLNSELQGWDQGVLHQKISNLADIISKMNNGGGPDIIGVCEVENLHVLQILVQAIHVPGRSYQVIHHDMSDQRGIDIAFIYDPSQFVFEKMFSRVITQRNATRDIMQVNFRTKKGNPFILIGNHWHSRISGELETEPYRIIAAETLSYWLERIVEIRGKDTPVMVMGDFNDEPFNKSISDYALSTHSKAKVLNARNPRLFNLMYPMMGRGIGTFFYNNFPFFFDQIMITKSMLKSNALIKPVQVSPGVYKVNVVMFPEMVAKSDYPKPISFGRPSKSGFNPEGYSDHFPVSVVVEE
jgi:hypothetical protein